VRDAPVIDVDTVRVRLARRFGPEVAGWCAGLPVLADEVARRWGLRLGRAWLKGGTSVVMPCESDDGEPLVLKLTPDLKIAADEACRACGSSPGWVQGRGFLSCGSGRSSCSR
jgi:streptomycin 6-kinase